MISDIKLAGIDHEDHPDYCDAYIESADKDGVLMTEDEIEVLNEDREFVLECVMNYLY